MAMIDKVKMACRVKTDAYDEQFEDLIEAAKKDLGIAGVVIPSEMDGLVQRAICTFCMMSFGVPDDYEHLKASYDEQKAQMSMATGYTTWTGAQ